MKHERAKTMNETGSVAARRRAKAATAPVGGECAFSMQEARVLLEALTSLKKGDSRVRLPLEWTGLQGKLAETFNDVVDLNERITAELARLREKVGREGKIKLRAEVS